MGHFRMDLLTTIVAFGGGLVAPGTRKIPVCHILEHDASTLIHEVIVAMKAGDGTVDNVTRAVHIHPALSEVVQRAASVVGA